MGNELGTRLNARHASFLGSLERSGKYLMNEFRFSFFSARLNVKRFASPTLFAHALLMQFDVVWVFPRKAKKRGLCLAWQEALLPCRVDPFHTGSDYVLAV